MKNEQPLSFENTSKAFSLKSDKELKKMRFFFSLMKQEIAIKIGSFFLKIALRLHFPIKIFLKNTLYVIFCGGETLSEVKNVVNKIEKQGIKVILDYGMEAGATDKSRTFAFQKVLDAINFSAMQPDTMFAVFKVSALSDVKILEKMQRGETLMQQEYLHMEEVKRKINAIGREAMVKKVLVMVDAEETWIQGAIDALVNVAMMEFNKSKAFIFNTLQCYRKDAIFQLEDLLKLAKKEGFYPGIKLVRGAYLEKERAKAIENGNESPLWESKPETDSCFNTALKMCVNNLEKLSFCMGTHNEESAIFLTKLMEKNKIDRKDARVLFAQLYGMSDNITFNLADAGYNVAKYLPYGPVKEVIPYLLRRADENKAVRGNTGRELDLIDRELERRHA